MEVADIEGTLVGASSLGLSVFDLFNEVLTADDMLRFLAQNNVEENHFGAGLIVRTFLLMIEFATGMIINMLSPAQIVSPPFNSFPRFVSPY